MSTRNGRRAASRAPSIRWAVHAEDVSPSRSMLVDDDGPADGLVGGVGELDGHPVVAASYDRSVADGTQSDRNQRKLGKLIHLAHTNRWPLVVVVDGDGARPDDHLPLPPIVVYTR